MDGRDSSSAPQFQTTIAGDSQLVRAPAVSAGDAPPSAATAADGKRKRGRPSRGQTAPRPPPAKRKKKEKKEEDEEEDVCFICFDGGSLVLCDYRGCPKAYHPTCIKREEAYFQSKAKWYCGWHICSVCQKAAHYMCYTCSYSLCKACTRGANFSSVRGNRGFCSTCMKTIILIENKEQREKESVKVDFDDKTSWEYLFKVYWVILKGRLSLTLDELMQSKNPWEEVNASYRKQQYPVVYPAANDGRGISLDSSSEVLQAKTQKQPLESSSNQDLSGTQSSSIVKPSKAFEPVKPGEQIELTKKDVISIEGESAKVTSLNDCKKWASKELLEFVAHMKNEDTSLSQVEVQALLLEYVKRNNLRDPRQKSQIICDSRLKNLFGRPRVGHIEMLKLLEYHFLGNDDSQTSVSIPPSTVGAVSSQVEADEKSANASLNNKKNCRNRKKCEERERQTNLDEYAAIDVHNINLIYLTRNSMELLSKDKEKFHNMVVGSIVRIRLSNDSRQDIYRLVQVVDTSKATAPYKMGDQTVDIALEVLNLDKKEYVTVDSVSNQGFSVDECRRLRQSIRCGLVRPFTVGEIQKKAVELQAVRLNDLLEAEILRLSNLRDRASEKGHKKELRECFEKLELLKTPEERQRRLQEIPEIHVDPKMNPKYESDEESRETDDEKRDVHERSKSFRSSPKGGKLISPEKNGKDEGSIRNHQIMTEERDAHASKNIAISAADGYQKMARSGSETSTSNLSSGTPVSMSNNETEKKWHYRDPSGKIQGPFSMEQLRKWNTTGFFPPDMRIWTNNEHEDCVLLTDVLNGQFHKAPNVVANTTGQSDVQSPVTVRGDVRSSENTYETERVAKESEVNCDGARTQTNVNSEPIRTDGLNSLLRILDLLEGNSDDSSDKSHLSTSPVSSSLVQRKENEDGQLGSSLDCGDQGSKADMMSPVEVIDGIHKDKCQTLGESSGENLQTLPLIGNDKDQVTSQTCSGQSSQENLQYSPPSANKDTGQSTSQTFLGQSLGENLQSSPPSGNKDTDQLIHQTYLGQSFGENVQSTPLSGNKGDSAAEPVDSSKQKVNVDIADLPSPTPKTDSKDLDVECLEIQLSLSSENHAQGSHVQDLPSPTPKPTNQDESQHAAEPNQSVPSGFAVQDSIPNWGGASGLVIGGIPEIGYEWGAHSLPQSEPNISSWQALLNEPIEFSTLDEESVSDLLAEVDAMESRSGGLASPTSAMKYGEEMIESYKNEPFSFMEVLSPTNGKRDSLTLNSSLDMQQSTLTGDPTGLSQVDECFPSKRFHGDSPEVSEGETKSADSVVPAYASRVSNHEMDRTLGWNVGSEAMDPGRGTVQVNMNLSLGGSVHEGGSDAWPPAPHSSNQDMVGRTLGRTISSDSMDPGWGTVQLNMNLSLGGPVHGVANVGWGPNMGTPRANPSMNRGVSGSSQPWDGQRRYGGERFAGPRDWNFPTGDSGYGRGRSSWSRPPYGGGGGGGYSRPPPKGQRVCKFYESGRCRKGASCDYLHP